MKYENLEEIYIYKFMLQDLKLKSTELYIYAIIYSCNQATNKPFDKRIIYFQQWTNRSKQCVINNLKSLEEKGFIIKFKKANSCEYITSNFKGINNGR